MTKKDDSKKNFGLEEEIFADLSAELSFDTMFNEVLLLSKVKNALREVRRARNYPKNYTEEQILDDMRNYFSNIRNIALYDYNQIGAEFQESLTENSVSRRWVDRDKLFDGIYAFVKVL